MDVNVNVFSDDLDEIGRNLALMQSQWGLAPFALWSCSGTLLQVDFASGPDAKGVVRVLAEMLPRAFVEKLAGAQWVWDRGSRGYTPRFTEAFFGIGKVSHETNTKRECLECLKALDAPKEVLSAMRAVKVSRTTETIDDLTPEDTDTVFSVRTIEKEKHAISSWTTTTDGVDFDITLDVGPSTHYPDRLRYTLVAKFDVTKRRQILLDYLSTKGVTAMNGSYSLGSR